jgi:hypothetical protein
MGLTFGTIVLYLFLSASHRRLVMVIYYTALPFVRLENGGLIPGEAVECPHSSAVIRRADAMSRNEGNAGAVALAHIDSPGLGDSEDPLILKTFGDVPDGFDCART